MNNYAYPYYPTRKLSYSFPKLTPYDKENNDNKNIKYKIVRLLIKTRAIDITTILST